ncbi:hypothetical protein LTR66_013242 [Elasticomyces elasticus]|nr:hypothetical protein LTR66_013242 [Elasticomyces elasticus]
MPANANTRVCPPSFRGSPSQRTYRTSTALASTCPFLALAREEAEKGGFRSRFSRIPRPIASTVAPVKPTATVKQILPSRPAVPTAKRPAATGALQRPAGQTIRPAAPALSRSTDVASGPVSNTTRPVFQRIKEREERKAAEARERVRNSEYTHIMEFTTRPLTTFTALPARPQRPKVFDRITQRRIDRMKADQATRPRQPNIAVRPVFDRPLRR